MQKVFSFLKPYRIHMVIALCLMLVELVVELWQPYLMAKIIDEGVMKKDLHEVALLGGFMLAISLFSFLSGLINSFYASHASQSFGFDLRKAMFEKIQSFSFSNFSRFSTSSLVTRMTNDVTQVQNTVFMSLRIMMRAPLLIIGGLIMAISVDVKLGLVLAGGIPFLVVFLIWARTKARIYFQSTQEKLDNVNNVIRENLIGMRLIKAYIRGNYEVKRFQKANKELRDKTASALRLIEFSTPVLMMVMNLAILLVLWFGGFEVSSGGAKVGEVVAIVNYGTRITGALSVVSMILMVFARFRASGQRIADVLETEIDLLDHADVDASFLIKNGKVEFKEVSFHYPDSPYPVLNNVSFSAKGGAVIAILGATGSGKSSLFQLVPRLYDVNSGAVFIDDKDIRSIKLDTLRGAIGYVPQEALLFTGTIAENISWGKENASEEEIIEAAKNAQIHETIKSFPQGYQSRIGQKGVNLSGGQKQRISIARALIRKPKILMLDDSTSALDLKTEGRLLHALKGYSCTTLLITQKISTAMAADNILLLEDGEIKEQGTHEELLKGSQLYRKIFETQFEEEKRMYV
ncbi:ABC transporter transmembrane domain-containing protein [Neobacillus terrae]|uniref:ABC transporter transmembrane domain-containing protein n=1 Tax=Neobacillus terrae TaxID=3034837 RepID=UPI00140E1FD6|nr:ABC transporter ATP-binding protein [Neobacillus terrae]